MIYLSSMEKVQQPNQQNLKLFAKFGFRKSYILLKAKAYHPLNSNNSSQCSQLYFPSQYKELELLEDLQKNYTKKIPEVQHMDYWSRLKHLKMYSQQRRTERYRSIYTWKVLEGIVPNCGIQHHEHIRRRRECSLPPLKGKHYVTRVSRSTGHSSSTASQKSSGRSRKSKQTTSRRSWMTF